MTTAAAMKAEPLFNLLSAYRRQEVSGFDELLEDGGAIREHWRPLLDGLAQLTDAERELRSARLARRVRETGIAYDIFADPNTSAQRWSLDLLPVVISAGEWRGLERALIQRARLFDAILNDVYGDQNLVRQGLIPAELLFSDPAYLVPCKGVLPNAGGLMFYAADLARGEDGQWRVIDNHTETLAGIGFTLANRVVHTHVAGDIFKDCNARRLAPYFQELQSTLTLHSGRENARIALLTPGPHHEDYFSHAYLARYLGYLIVEGHDLKTRNSQVYLKTLEGLKELDLIVRCISGKSSDPLELDPTGFIGPSGLLRVCRKSPHLVVNAIGTALAQNRGLGPYLPQLAQHILGEDLQLHDAHRRWLGNADARQELFAYPERFTIRKAQEGTGRPGQAALGWEARALSTSEREKMRHEIALHGATLVAEEKIGFSSSPVYADGGLVPKPFAIRVYISRTSSGEYQVMPGGLAMCVAPGRAVALSAPDGQTRDVWVIGEGEQAPHISLWRPTLATARVERSQRVIQSRVADDLFWLGRYSERADWTMRVLRGALRRVEEDSGPDTGQRAARKCLEVLLGKDLSSVIGSRETPPDDEIERLCRRLITTGLGSRTLERTLDGLYRVAHLVRDRLSLEAWQTLSKFRGGEPWRKALNSAHPVEILDLLDEGITAVAAFNGFMHENMTRNFGWSFLDMGRRIERAQNLSEAILTLFIPVSDPEETSSSLLLLLELADSFITYRSRYRLDPMLPLVLDLLLLDETNPRSLAYQLSAIARHLESLPDSSQGAGLPDDRRLIIALLTSIRLADVEAMAKEETAKTLESLLMDQLDMLPELSNAISRRYFNVLDEAPHRTHTRVGPSI
ncbi:circularly permuted type 2 ATP-grasp protein [Hyphomicrobium sp. MC8b]|uniref:circularly permuted type 2 ATP-grasp protein n=1 Tax=Hyphomicrobium sp. MC8b TaxID=300273 RepID=UPI00391B667E